MVTMSRNEGREVGNVSVKYVLVSPEGGRWRRTYEGEGDVYYQRVENVCDPRRQ
jgi:hypothetical protein